MGYAAASLNAIERTLEADLKTMRDYFQTWHLKMSQPKTLCSVFHLANRLASKELVINLDGKKLKFDPEPTYLGITLDRSLTFRPHIKKVVEKTEKRINLVRKLAGTDWGASFTTLRTTALALVYSTAEYAAPVWSHSRHTSYVDSTINGVLRVITGAIAPTPTDFLPIIAGIAPAQLRRDYLTLKLSAKSNQPDSLIPYLTADAPEQRIRRQHFAMRARDLHNQNPLSTCWVLDRWSEAWISADVTRLHEFVEKPSSKPPGYNLERKAWVRLNRLRTGWGKTNTFLYKIGASDSDLCECGHPQTVCHIIADCPVFSSPNGVRGLVNLDAETINWLKTCELPV